MQFVLTEDQQLLVDGVRSFLAAECTADAVRDTWESGTFDAGRWKALADLGVVGLTVPADVGGMGLGFVDLVPLLVEAGRVVLPEPLIEVTAVSTPVLTALGGDIADEWLPRVASGDAVVVTALGTTDPYPAHVEVADLVLVCNENRVVAASAESFRAERQSNVDPSRPTASVSEVGGEVVATGDQAHHLIRLARSRAATGAAAFQVGIGHAVIEQAVSYALQREQFGKPIGTFQAVKHRLASALVDVQFARPLVERAAWSLDEGSGDGPVHASMAKAFADEAVDAAVKHALQVHGAIGYTWECDLQLFMKRSWSLAASFGSTEHHWQLIDDQVV